MISRFDFRRNNKGIGSIFGMIFFLIIFMIIFASFITVLSQNTRLEQATMQTRQMDNEAAREQLRFFTQTGNTQFLLNNIVGSNSVTVSCRINNTGTLPVQLVRLWVEDRSTEATGSIALENIVISQGEVINLQPIPVSVTISDPDQTVFWFVTARGNLFNQYTNQGPQGPPGVISFATTTQGIGSIALAFDQFRIYTFSSQPTVGTNLGNPLTGNNSYTVSKSQYYIFKIPVWNVDKLGRTIVLSGDSAVWASATQAGTLKSTTWQIIDVNQAQNTITSLSKASTTLIPCTDPNSASPTILYFGVTGGSWLSFNQNDPPVTIALNILLYGGIAGGTNNYGQNLPFVSIRMIY